MPTIKFGEEAVRCYIVTMIDTTKNDFPIAM
jgi:hypothetical protein